MTEQKGKYIRAPYKPVSVLPLFTDKYILTRAKELWPDIDIESAQVSRAERPNVDVFVLVAGASGQPHRHDTIRVRPLMTTVGLALSWVPEANVVVYYPKGSVR